MQSAAFSPDGKTVAAAYLDHMVIWDSKTGRLTRKLALSSAGPAFAFDPKDPHSIAIADDHNQVALWDDRASIVRRVPVPQYSIALKVAYTPDGKTLAAADIDGGIYLLDTATARWTGKHWNIPYADINRKPNSFDALTVSPTGEVLAVNDDYGHVYLCRLSGGAPLVLKVDQAADARTDASIAFSPDGKTLAIADKGLVRIYDVASGKFMTPLTSPGSTPGVVRFSPDGKTLATLDRSHGQLSLWDLPTRHVAVGTTLPAHPTGVGFGPDGKTLMAYNWLEPNIYLYSVKYTKV
jgi:WD40 repeat protein